MRRIAAVLRPLRRAARSFPPLLIGVSLVLALVVCIWIATWQRSRLETAQAVAAAIQANSNLAMAYEENAANAIGDVDQTLRLVEIEFRNKGATLRDAFEGWPLNFALIRGLAIVGADATTRVASGDAILPGMASRDDFLFHRDQAAGGLYIAKPESGPPGRWRVAISRRIDKPDGSFGGIVLAMVDPAYFVDFYRRADLGAQGLVSLVRRDGIVLARVATRASTFGDDMRASVLIEQAALKPNGAFTTTGRINGVPRLVSYRTMARYPLIVQVGTASEETLAPVRERTRLYYLLAALASNVIVLVAIGVARSFARQERDLEAVAQAQAELSRSEARSKAITENMAGGVVTTDVDGTILTVNGAACNMFGYRAREMVGKHLSRLVHASGYEYLAGVFGELRAREGPFKEDGREFLCVRRDGSLFEVEVMISSLVMDGACTYIGIVHDISERKGMERALRANEARYRATFDQALVGIAHTALDGRLNLVNHRLCEMLGYSDEELRARTYRDITYPEDLALSVARAEKLVGDPKLPFVHHETKRYVRKDGSIMWALTSVCLVRREDGSPDYFLAMVQDITDLKRVERMQSEFVSTVSHELRTPLTSIRGSLGLLAGGVAGALPQTARELVVIAENNCERLIRLVNDILDTEKIDSGKMRFELRVAPLGPLIERAVESLQGFAGAHGVTLRLAAPREPVCANVDPDRFIQVLTNLVSNAVKFTPSGTPVEIALERAPGGGARIEIRDRGPGIPKEFQPRVFQRFSQADASDSRQKGGTGLGLAIAKGIVERLGGTIGFHCPAGEGTTFFVELPAPAHSAAAPKARDVSQEARMS